MTTIIVHWRERPEEGESAYSKWTDVQKYAWQEDGCLWFRTPTDAQHFVNYRATQLITILEK